MRVAQKSNNNFILEVKNQIVVAIRICYAFPPLGICVWWHIDHSENMMSANQIHDEQLSLEDCMIDKQYSVIVSRVMRVMNLQIFMKE